MMTSVNFGDVLAALLSQDQHGFAVGDAKSIAQQRMGVPACQLLIPSCIAEKYWLMGIEDRDWYREETAKKNGMFYNRKNATYSADPRYFPKQFRGSAAVPAERRKTSQFSPQPKTMHPLLVVLATFAICGGVFVLLKIISQFLR